MKAGILAGGLFLALLVAIVVVIDLVRIPDMFEVDGDAQIPYVPDTAQVDVAVSAQADVANDAAQQVAVTMAGVINALKGDGVADADITSLGVSSAPTPQYGNSNTTPPAYTAQQSVRLVVHDLARLGALASAASNAGANNWSVSYTVTDTSAAENEARQAALLDAIKAADTYAAGGGFRRGRVLKLLESDVQFPYADYGNRDFVMNRPEPRVFAAAAGVSNAIAGQPRSTASFVIPKPEPQTVSATVHVLFELN